MIDDSGRLEDILEAINKIQAHTGTDRQTFDRDEMLQVWVMHYLQIIGECVSRLTPDLIERYPEVPWKNMVGMRNILVHQYFEVDLEIIWRVIDRDLSPLKAQIQTILNNLSD